jgi:hypothetical protein
MAMTGQVLGLEDGAMLRVLYTRDSEAVLLLESQFPRPPAGGDG